MSIQLSRNTKPLLRKVSNRTHAPPPPPPPPPPAQSGDIDINASPESTEDEEVVEITPLPGKAPAETSKAPRNPRTTRRVTGKRKHGEVEPEPKSSLSIPESELDPFSLEGRLSSQTLRKSRKFMRTQSSNAPATSSQVSAKSVKASPKARKAGFKVPEMDFGATSERNGIIREKCSDFAASQTPQSSFRIPKSVELETKSREKRVLKGIDINVCDERTSGDSADMHNISDDSSPLSSPPLSDIDGFQRFTPPKEDLPQTAQCPACGESVDDEALAMFKSKHKRRLRWRDKLAFCVDHKRLTAQTTWQQRGYPHINWPGLEDRVVLLHDRVDALLEQQKPSSYWDDLATKVKSGRSRNILRGPDTTDMDHLGSAGYYGPKGAKIIQMHITVAFAGRLRDLARSDSVLQAVGIGGFIQTVLVPEIAVMLVMQDMGEDEDQARDTVAESTEVGELVSLEDEDHVVDAGDEDKRLSDATEPD